jgi:hypothetical protein
MTTQTLPLAAGNAFFPLDKPVGDRMFYSRIIGALFPLGFLAYGVGFGLIMSVVTKPAFLAHMADHQDVLTLGAFLMLLNTAVEIGKGVLMFPILENHGKRTALVYLASMVLEVALMAVGILLLLVLIPLGHSAGDVPWARTLGNVLIHGNEMAYQVAMMTVAVANVFVWLLTFRVRLLPRPLSIWGVAGYVVLTAGSIAEMFGIPVSLMASIPGGLFELALGIWLMIRGFKPAAYAKEAA